MEYTDCHGKTIAIISWYLYWYVLIIFTALKRSCWKVMYSQVSVCPQGVGGWVLTPRGGRAWVLNSPPTLRDIGHGIL